MKKIILLALLLISNAYAEQAEEKKGFIDKTLEGLGLDKQEFDDTKVIDFSIIPGPFYNPEQLLGVGVSAVGLYQPDKNDAVSQLSNLTINGFASINGSFGVQVKNQSFFSEDKYRFYATLAFYSAPEVYYGIGYEENVEDLNGLDYDNEEVNFKPLFLLKTFENTYFGGGFDFSYVNTSNIENSRDSVVSKNESDVDFPNKSLSSGLVAHITYDSRDFILNAKEGMLMEMEYAMYTKSLGSESNFQRLDLTYNGYASFENKNSILAWQVRGQFREGDVPWNQLSLIGGPKGLRGYFLGRYRDKQALITQVEYRKNLPWRHGVAFWVGAGAVADKVSEFESDEVLRNIGLGYRFEVKERVNVRLDYGIGNGESGFYMNIAEAF